MRAFTSAVDAEVDVGALGARTGLLWSAGPLTVAGIGEAMRIPVTLGSPDSVVEAQRRLAAVEVGSDPVSPTVGVVALAALPFDRSVGGELIVPEVVVVDSGGSRWATTVADTAPDPTETVGRMVEALVPTDPTPQPRTATVSAPIAPEIWRDEILTPVRDRIRNGELTKVVIARELVVSVDQPFDLSAVVDRLRSAHTAAMVFAVDGFLGASPELLVARRQEVVRAHPLAGTAARASDPDDDHAAMERLLASEKDHWEHRITIDWLLDELLPFCSYVDAEPEPTVVSLANVHHLGTRVEGRLSRPPASVLELVSALHPTPAVGGRPQLEALEVIGEVEQADRGRYAGPVGWVDGGGNGEFAVGIRSAEIEDTRARLMAGVGVVADSDPDMELAETRAKFQALLPTLVRL